MELHKFQEVFCDVLPIIEKASPIISGLLGSNVTSIIIGLLASLVGGHACDHSDILQKLKDDPDLYAKLSKLDCTHGKWLKDQLL